MRNVVLLFQAAGEGPVTSGEWLACPDPGHAADV